MSENSTPPGQIPHYTTAEVAKLLGMAVRSVQLMVDRGDLEAWKTPGGHRRITRASVERWRGRQGDAATTSGAPAAAPAPAPAQAGTGPRVLLIEDSVHFQNLVRLLVQRHFPDVQLHVAHDGITGMALYGQIQPDVLLVDILLPDIDGAALITTLRTHEQFARCKLLVVTSLDAAEREAYAFALGGARVIHKPQLVQELPEALGELLGRQAA
ncbi:MULTISPECIES: response regulator [Delftia]|jgi:excisionase family DNA binding protein|uniref:Response regulator receiver protein n=2 Tax=Delftia acidovorans TaxID=80866 RepID=A9BYH1_DELAS|nr:MULTISPECIES: response regulator [Delftia]MBA4007014.1 helix-turn-helix domain-containing protein [Delftia sp.]PIF39344.1 excisionase family DNA binding protein [Burkholderiales bacterium 23]PIF65476.1 LOW QUALITY PROTEIN: excisionase family DNA binding protein [Delftia sp. 60]ABX34514.1 response regulator receiver protein [Delftia acidovorans SPH-1]ATH13989.1 DNA-binding protein [Delftia acidovorans]